MQMEVPFYSVRIRLRCIRLIGKKYVANLFPAFLGKSFRQNIPHLESPFQPAIAILGQPPSSVRLARSATQLLAISRIERSGKRPDQQTKSKDGDEEDDKPDEAGNRLLYFNPTVAIVSIAECVKLFSEERGESKAQHIFCSTKRAAGSVALWGVQSHRSGNRKGNSWILPSVTAVGGRTPSSRTKCSGKRPGQEAECKERDKADDNSYEACKAPFYFDPSIVIAAVAGCITLAFPKRRIVRLNTYFVERKERQDQPRYRVSNRIDQQIEKDRNDRHGPHPQLAKLRWRSHPVPDA
jgi:hypothetical protein